jgi:hypothetical protein
MNSTGLRIGISLTHSPTCTQLFWLRCFVIFVNFLMEILGLCLNSAQWSRVSKYSYIPVPFLTNQRIIRHYIIWATKGVVKEITVKLEAINVNRRNNLPIGIYCLNYSQSNILILTVSWQHMTNQTGNYNFYAVFLDMTTCSVAHNTNFSIKTNFTY